MLTKVRLYHSIIFSIGITFFVLSGCTPAETPKPEIKVTVLADGSSIDLDLLPGSTVDDALRLAGKELGDLDRVEPPGFSVIVEDMQINVIRVREEFNVVEDIIPFEKQLQPSELLSEGEQRTLQMGENGLKEVTYRKLIENDVEISVNPIKTVIIKEPIPQIILVGVQTSFSPMDIPGRLVYLNDGNAWMMEQSTANRIPIITSGDMDGRIFELSDDGKWLLFTRKSDDKEIINTLWIVNVDKPEEEYDIHIENVVHFAEWKRDSDTTIAYSTVEPRQAPPGWQANNNLLEGSISSNGRVSRKETIIDTNSGGIYGWWGSEFSFSPSESIIAFAQPSKVGYIDFQNGESLFEKNIIPLITRSDWAWVPGISWSPDGGYLFIVEHTNQNNSVNPEESPDFDLIALSTEIGVQIDLVQQVGMFAYPLPSPIMIQANEEESYMVAYLQAISPKESETSRYIVSIIDRDGSNRRRIFPSTGEEGLDPIKNWGVWSPDVVQPYGNYVLALIYKDSLWVVDPLSGESRQITGDEGIIRVDWK
ncbi:MAG TPA: hypothetical protein G4N95_00935 [Anaerolineae bacterium]|nr:hypothetical protein [Anaerolineae bacterium]